MDFWNSLGGMVTVSVVSADVTGVLSAFTNAGIAVSDTMLDGLTLTTGLARKDLKLAKRICNKRGEKISVIGKTGVFWRLKALVARPVLMIGMVICIFLGFYVPSRIFFVRVEGNIRIPANLILEEAASCGIRFGASRGLVRSEKMKNSLLESMPQLQWAGVNTRGCVAVITVRERQETQTSPTRTGVSSIVASCDGVIESCTAEQGNLLCKPGMAVKTGQTLISGYTDCGLVIRATQAKGEIYARTERNISISAMQSVLSKTNQKKQIKKYAVIIGKKRINFSKDSGILDVTCDKMYVEKFITLPGGFVLPVSFVVETYVPYETEESVVHNETAQKQLSAFADAYLREQMVAGEILTQTETINNDGTLFTLQGSYSCREMIGRIQEEEIISPDG